MDYSELMDDLDAAIFTGDLLFTDRDELKDYIERWQRAIDAHEKAMEEDDS